MAIVPEEFAGHWQLTVEFLKIVTEHWPRLSRRQAARLAGRAPQRADGAGGRTARRSGSPHPVIAAGSTGTVPATARLLKVIASLPNGAVVLPGLDHHARRGELGDARRASRASASRHGRAVAQARRAPRRGRLRAGERARRRSPARGSISPAKRCAPPRAPSIGRNFSAARSCRPTGAQLRQCACRHASRRGADRA